MAGRVAILAHCLLNPFSKVRGSPDNTNVAIKLHNLLRENNFGIIQLPCPELLHSGLTRWGQTRYQYSSIFFRRHCEELTKSIVSQIQEYLRCDVVIGPIIGIDGSPSCGVAFTCDGPWGGELSHGCDLESKLKQMQIIQGKGIFMEVLEQTLHDKSLKIDFVGIKEEKPDKGLEKIRSLILDGERKEGNYE